MFEKDVRLRFISFRCFGVRLVIVADLDLSAVGFSNGVPGTNMQASRLVSLKKSRTGETTSAHSSYVQNLCNVLLLPLSTIC